MNKGKGFFDGIKSASEGKTPVDPHVIKNVSFFDTPPEKDDEGDAKDRPYVPTESEWNDLWSFLKLVSFTAGFATGLSALTFILLLCKM